MTRGLCAPLMKVYSGGPALLLTVHSMDLYCEPGIKKSSHTEKLFGLKNKTLVHTFRVASFSDGGATFIMGDLIS